MAKAINPADDYITEFPDMPGCYITRTQLAKDKKRKETLVSETTLDALVQGAFDLRRDFRDLPECFEGLDFPGDVHHTIKQFITLTTRIRTLWG